MRLFIAWCLAVLGVAFLLSSPASAGYAQLAPPPGITSVGGVTSIPVGTAANGARYAGGHVLANASLNVGARTVVVPVGLRVAANAATFTATKLNPWLSGLALAAAAAPFVMDMLDRAHADDSLLDLVFDPATSTVKKKLGGSDPAPFTGTIEDQGIDLNELADSRNGQKFPAFVGARMADYSDPGRWNCSGDRVYISPNTVIDGCGPGVNSKFVDVCQGGQGWHGGMCVGGGSLPMKVPPTYSNPTPAQIAEFNGISVNPAILPALGEPIPIDPNPIINPASQPSGDVLVDANGNPAPQLQPSTQPLRYPDGDPVPNPNTNPQTYTQPWNEVWPSPTPSEPWRVDIRPTTTIVNSPTPAPDPVPNPGTNPGTSNPPTGTGQTDCEKFPNSLGCAPLSSPPDIEIPKQTKTITLQDGPAFGGSGSCPASVYVTAGGQSVKAINMEQACGFISNYMRPLVLALAFLSAVMIVLPRE